MRSPRRLIGALALAAALSTTAGCTDPEGVLFNAWHAVNPFAAEAELSKLTPEQLAPGVQVLDDTMFAALTAHVAELELLPACTLYQLWSDQAGLPARFHGIMWRESNCIPTAHNPSGATGLYQIMPGHARRCGTTPAGLYDPATNIRCAVIVFHAQGYGAWSQTA